MSAPASVGDVAGFPAVQTLRRARTGRGTVVRPDTRERGVNKIRATSAEGSYSDTHGVWTSSSAGASRTRWVICRGVAGVRYWGAYRTEDGRTRWPRTT